MIPWLRDRWAVENAQILMSKFSVPNSRYYVFIEFWNNISILKPIFRFSKSTLRKYGGYYCDKDDERISKKKLSLTEKLFTLRYVIADLLHFRKSHF